ncbi:hypothetical protein NKG05_03900 [Oerskovia sp. M15]
MPRTARRRRSFLVVRPDDAAHLAEVTHPGAARAARRRGMRRGPAVVLATGGVLAGLATGVLGVGRSSPGSRQRGAFHRGRCAGGRAGDAVGQGTPTDGEARGTAATDAADGATDATTEARAEDAASRSVRDPSSGSTPRVSAARPRAGRRARVRTARDRGGPGPRRCAGRRAGGGAAPAPGP